MKLSFFDYIKYFLLTKNYFPKKKLIHYSMKRVKNKIDISYILQKLNEIDKLKLILFDDD